MDVEICYKSIYKEETTTLPFGRPSKGGESKCQQVRQLHFPHFSSFIWRLVDWGCPKRFFRQQHSPKGLYFHNRGLSDGVRSSEITLNYFHLSQLHFVGNQVYVYV
jgi:hypothetical protein